MQFIKNLTPTATINPLFSPTPTILPRAQVMFVGIDLYVFVILSVTYILVVHFALSIRREFDIFLMAIYFILGGIMGWWFHSYEAGFILGVVLSFLFF